MDDRAISVLDNYECKVLRTWKGRGAILCDTDQGLKIIKEYVGAKEKILLQDALLCHIKEQGYEIAETIVRNKEGELLTQDGEHTCYLLKDYFEGRECNVRDEMECMLAMKRLAKFHAVSELKNNPLVEEAAVFSLEREYEKHNKELKKVRNYVRQKSQKTDFEIYLMKYYDTFYEKALEILEELKKHDWKQMEESVRQSSSFCHGDYQYHNILLNERQMAVINFEKYIIDNRVRDVYLFMRKVLEKNNWSEEMGKKLLDAYEEEYPLLQKERLQLGFRFLYPEKFWKIVNFYFNSGKAFISGRNSEKLEKLLKSQDEMQKFIQSMKNMIQ